MIVTIWENDECDMEEKWGVLETLEPVFASLHGVTGAGSTETAAAILTYASRLIACNVQLHSFVYGRNSHKRQSIWGELVMYIQGGAIVGHRRVGLKRSRSKEGMKAVITNGRLNAPSRTSRCVGCREIPCVKKRERDWSHDMDSGLFISLSPSSVVTYRR